MKKILAIVLALSMALSLTGAFAGETPAYNNATITVNINSQLMQMMMGGGSESIDALLSIINKIEFNAAEGENNAAVLSINGNGDTVLAAKGAMTENGYIITTDLLPSYAVLLDNETLAAIMTAEQTGETGAMPEQLAAIQELIAPNVTEPVPGEYTVNGKNYAVKSTMALDGETIMAILAMFSKMLSDNADMTSFPDAAEANVLINIDVYMAADNSAAYDLVLTEEGEIEGKALIELTPSETDATVAFAAYLPQGTDHADWETAVAALNAGEDYGYAFVGSFNLKDFQAMAIDLVIYNGGQYLFGVKLDANEAGYDFVLSMMSPDMPFISLKAVLGMSETPAEVAVDTTGLTVVDAKTLLESIQNGTELGQAVQTDLSYGLSMAMINLIQLFPEEMTVIMDSVNPPADEAPAVEAPTEEAPVVPAA